MAVYKYKKAMDILKENYKFNFNPFSIVPNNNLDQIVWAGFKELRMIFENKIKQFILIPQSCIVLNSCKYGNGETHAAKYFSKPEVLEDLAGDNAIPYSIIINLPIGKNITKDIFTQIIDKLDITFLREKFRGFVISDSILNEITDSELIKNVVRLFFDYDITPSKVKAYLYGNQEIDDLFIAKNIQRKLDTDVDYWQFISALFSFLTYNKEKYSCILFWIDGIETVRFMTSSNAINVSLFIRSLIDSTHNKLLLFLNFMESSNMDVDDLSSYLMGNIKSKIKDTIYFPNPQPSQLKQYLFDLINNPVVKEDVGICLLPEDVIDLIIEDGHIDSIRKFNDVISIVLEYAVLDNKEINIDYYNSIKSEIFSN